MKKFLYTTAIFIATVSMYSQTEATTKDGQKVILNKDGTWMYEDCAQLLKTGDFGGKLVPSSKESIKITTDNGITGIDISLIGGAKSIILKANNLSRKILCVNKNAPMVVEFTDGTKTTLTNATELDCEGRFACFLSKNLGNVKDLELLKAKKIKKVTMEYTDTENGAIKKNLSIFAFNEAQADKFMKTLQCLSNL